MRPSLMSRRRRYRGPAACALRSGTSCRVPVPVTIVAASLDIGQVVLVLATLSFLGLGAPPPAPELGSMVAQGSAQLLNYWWLAIIPAAAVLVLSLVGNLAGDAIRDMVEER